MDRVARCRSLEAKKCAARRFLLHELRHELGGGRRVAELEDETVLLVSEQVITIQISNPRHSRGIGVGQERARDWKHEVEEIEGLDVGERRAAQRTSAACLCPALTIQLNAT